MCRTLSVSSSGYYQHHQKQKNYGIDQKDFLIKTEFNEHKGKYGSPRISKKLSGKGYRMSQSTVARRMKKMGLRVKKKKRYKTTTNSNHSYGVAENLLDQNFSVNHPNAVWVSDITYILVETGWVYLAVILDLFSRKIVGWQTSKSLEHGFVVNALSLAVMRRSPSKGLIFHSDRGVQYACHEFKQAIENHGFLQSMSAKGNCYDNAVAESFFKTLKYELIDDYRFYDKNDLDKMLFEKIDWEYNCRRMHSTIYDQTPDAFEKQYFNKISFLTCPIY